MQERIFISHSSAWKKDMVEPLAKALGRDQIIIDKYNFETGEKIYDEIIKAIKSCRYFLLLISKEALVKDGWVEKEINKVRDLIDEKKVIFWACIIDPDVDWNDSRIKPWIKNEIILNKIPSYLTLARLLKKKIRKDIAEKDPQRYERHNLFRGRDDDMKKLKAMMDDVNFEDNGGIINTIIVSGIRHLGRKRFLAEYLSKELKHNTTPQDILKISLSIDDDSWVLAQKINDLIGQHSANDLNDLYHKDKIALIVELINQLRSNKEYFIIEDNGAIVGRNGMIAEWALDLIKHRELSDESIFHIVSRFAPREDIHNLFHNIIHINVRNIESAWMLRLCKSYAILSQVEVNEIVAQEIVDKSKGYPAPVYAAIDALGNGHQRRSCYRRAIANSIDGIENNFKSIVEEIRKENKSSISFMQILSTSPFLSIDNLDNIWGPGVDDMLDILDSYCVTEYTGKDDEIIAINSGLADYIRRKETIWDKNVKKRLLDYTTSQIQLLKSGQNDIGGYFLAKRRLIEENIERLRPEDLVPSLILKLINEKYYIHEDDKVIFLADQVLGRYGSKLDLERQLRYKLCCALCRQGNDRLRKEVEYFDKDSYSYNFLLGFYYRHVAKNKISAMGKASEYYMKAYDLRMTRDMEYDDAKLLHELWIVKYQLKDPSALDFAKECYDKRPADKYHIEAYYRSLISQPHKDKALISQLIEEMSIAADTHDDTIVQTMKAEWKYYQDQDMENLKENIDLIISEAKTDHQKGYPLRVFKEICKKQETLPIYDSIKKKYKNIDDSSILYGE